jgi:hypothetical protein
MPLMLTDAELAMVRELAQPLEPHRRGEFLEAIAQKMETSVAPAAIGPGVLHRIAREVLQNFWDAPPDLRSGRVGPRGGSHVG